MVKIDGVDYTRYAVLPIQLQYARDESLNQGVLTLKNIDRELPFEPASLVEIDGERWLVGADNVRKINYYKNKFQHEIVLTEETKLLEKYFVDSCTFTNPIYMGNEVPTSEDVFPYIELKNQNLSGIDKSPQFKENSFGIVSGYKSPIQVGSNFVFKKFSDIFENHIGPAQSTGGITTKDHNYFKMEIVEGGTVIYNSGWVDDLTKQQDIEIVLKKLTYIVRYSYKATYKGLNIFLPDSEVEYFVVEYKISGKEMSELSRVKITITDVVNKLLYLSEIQRKGNLSKFYFNKEQSDKYSSIIAPEMSITNSTLREALNVVGGYIHAEVRLDNSIIYFDEYSTNENAVINKKPVVESSSQSIEQFCSEIESNAQNLIPDDKEQNGNIVDPYLFGYITPRAETGKVEVTDATAFIPTKYPIHKLIKLEMGYLPEDVSHSVGDITDYVVEKTVYDILSSYTDNPPEESKAHHIYWQQGQSGITGLAWEQESAIDQAFENNAITNIINDVLGTNYEDVNINITNLQFRITYMPIINARVKQVKTRLNSKKLINAYNQSAYKISSTQYGENMKGVVARLGNIEKTQTYIYNKGEELPKLASKVDEDYVISAIKVEKQHNHNKVTLGLSKKFNRQNQFVGISNEQRFYEISEKNAIERYSIYEDFAVLSRNNIAIEAEEKDRAIITDSMLSKIRQYLLGFFYYDEISQVIVELQNADGTQASEVEEISLPVISYSFGNSACYSFDFENNYGAGSYIAGPTYEGKRLQTELRYPNRIGEFEFMGVKFYNTKYYFSDSDGSPNNYADALEMGLNLPKIVVPEGTDEFYPDIDTGNYPLRIKKDNRENIHFSYQIHCITDDDNIIIGSALSKTFAVSRSGTASKAVAYVLDRKIGEFENEILNLGELTGIDIGVTISDNENKLKIDNITANISGKSLVVVNSDSNELLFAINEDITALEEVEMPSIYFRHKIYTE